MKGKTIEGGRAALVALALAATGVSAQQDFSWSGSVARGDAIAIRGVNGAIVARPTNGTEVRVTAEKHSKRDAVSTVSIQVVEDGRGVLICAVYPSRDRGEPNRCARGHGYHMDVKRNDVKVDFTVEVPAGVELKAVTVNGDVTSRDLSDAVEAVTVNGDIEIDTDGSATATTVNGSIEARVGRVSDDLEFTTVNGGVTLTLPDGARADVEATTVNGNIETDFPITIRGRWGPRSAKGEIGGGGPSLEVTTVNGSIRLQRAG